MLIQAFVWTRVAATEFAGSIHSRLTQVVRSERGATAAEYALLVALIAVAIIAGAKALGSSVNSKLDGTATTIGP